MHIANYSFVVYFIQFTVTFIDDILRYYTESIIIELTNGSIISIYGLYDNTPCYDSILFNLTKFGWINDINP